MTQQTDANPHDDGTTESLPQQEQFYRAPARFGNVPVEAEPKGWDRRQGFQKHYPRVSLPTQIIERVKFGNEEQHEPNRLIWGDNLHIMRQMPTNSVDLIYIDPPFFSGKEFNVIWGDNNELRSFNDIWQGGLDGYLIWLNARLYEMKRILKPTGSIYVHCDWHASHYIKVEMDKIFGYDNFMNEIVWCYRGGGVPRDRFARKHDIIFWYKKGSRCKFNLDAVRIPYSGESLERLTYTARAFRTSGVYDNYKPNQKGKHPEDYFQIQPIMPSERVERIGYPTQKPLELIQRLLEAASDPGDLVADFFVGGGSFAAAAAGARSTRTDKGRPAIEFRPELARRWLVCDQSRVAIAVTAERLKQQVMARGIDDAPVPDFTVEQWGIYEANRLSQMPKEDFRDFVLRAYGASRVVDTDADEHIHGWRNQLPIWIGAPDLQSQATAADVRDFANAIRRTVQYQQSNLRDGVMLAWGFRSDAVEAAEQLRRQEHIDVNFIRLKQVRIGDAEFREHIVGRSTDRADYGEFLTFVQPPEVNVGWRALGGRSVMFDAGDTAVVNSDATIINVQWDFNYNGVRFTATQGHSFEREGKGQKRKPKLRVTHKFPYAGKFSVACRVQDGRGGEGMWSGEVEVR